MIIIYHYPIMLSRILLKKMPPEGGDLFIDEDDDGVGALLGGVEEWDAYDPEPNEHVYEGDGLAYVGQHAEYSKFHEPRHHWHDNSLVSKPKP
jgi:hypothetical protein